MPCSACGHYLVSYDGKALCPRCKVLSILDPVTAITIWERKSQFIVGLYNEELSRWNVEYLLAVISAERERLSRSMLKEYGIMQLGKLATYTLLLDSVIRFSKREGMTPKPDDITRLVDIYGKVLGVEDELLRLKSCTGNVIYLERFNQNDLDMNKLLNIFEFVENEKYMTLRKTAAIYDIYSAVEAPEVMAKYKAEEQTLNNARKKYRHYNPDKFIETNFTILSAINALFLRNRKDAEVFGRLREYKRLIKNPETLMKFVWEFRLNDEVQTFSPINDFIRKAVRFFNASKEKVIDVLLFDRYNKSVFPLFVRFDVPGLGDAVVIPHRFSYFIYTFLHAILTEDLFNAETAKRSLEFEKERIKHEFQKQGFLYLPNVIDKKDSSLEIDGLAIKGNKCYVVECKGWRLAKFMDEKQYRDQTIRDLRGIVTGEKYTTKNGQIVTQKRPSLVSKVNYIKENYSKHVPKDIKINEIYGLIVTISYLPIHQSQKIRMISVEEIAKLD